MNDTQVILMALQKERDELHNKIMQVDRIMSRIEGIGYTDNEGKQPVKEIAANTSNEDKQLPDVFTNATDIKVQVLMIFDIVKKAAKLKDLQAEFFRLTGKTYNIREAIRTLNRARIVRMIKLKDSQRGVYWIKDEWIENGHLKDEFKPEGFDLFYKAGNLIYE